MDCFTIIKVWFLKASVTKIFWHWLIDGFKCEFERVGLVEKGYEIRGFIFLKRCKELIEVWGWDKAKKVKIWLLLVGLRTMTWKLWFQYLWFWFGKWCWDGCVKILKAYGKRTWWWLSFWLVGKESLGGVWMVQFGWLSHIVFYGAFPDLILFFFKTLGMGCGFRDPIFFFSSVHVLMDYCNFCTWLYFVPHVYFLYA